MADRPAPTGGAVGLRGDARIAVVGPFSGVRAAWGELLLAAVERHRVPGIAWEPHDDRGDTDQARKCAAEIVADGGYRAVIGHFNSLGALATLPLYRRAGIPLLLPLSTRSGLLAEGAGAALRWCAEDSGQVVALARAAHRAGAEELLVTHDGSAYGAGLAAAFLGLAAPPLPVRGMASYEAGTGTLVVCGTHAGAAAIAERRLAAGLRGELLFCDDCAVEEFADLLGPGGRSARVARLVGGPARYVEDAFTALTGALIAEPELTGMELLTTVRTHAGQRFTPGGDPDRHAEDGWEVVAVGEISAGLGVPPPRGDAAEPDLDCVVIGCGIVGSSVAAALVGAGRVAMVGPGLDGPSATRQSGGLIRAYDPDPRARALAARSFRLLWGRPAGQTRAFGFRETGSLVLLGESDVAEAVRGIEELRAAGIDVELVDREFVERTWPGLAVPDIAAAVWEPGGGYAAALATAGAYRAEAMRGGVLRWYGRVPGVRPHRHGVLVETDLGPVTARTAVVATGSGVPDLRNRRGTAIGPTARAKRIRYGYFDAGGRRLPVVADLVTGLWGRPNLAGGSYLAGRPVDEWDVPPGGGDELDPAQVDHIRAGAKTRWPWVGDAAYLGGRFGADLYGGAGPALGTMCAGLPVVAAGMFSGGGVKAAPAAAEVVADVVRALLT